jgi:ATP-dependent RNA helicase RhlE
VRIAPVKATTELIEQSVCYVPKSRKAQLLAHLISTRAVGRALVFTRTKRGADRLSKHLNKSGIRAEAMHGDKSQNARQRSLAAFKSSRPPILVATDVAARGIDVDSVSHVFNYDLPNEPETYVHRIGRTGRAGTAGVAVSFCDH